jgi:hypothetical protein
MKENLVVAVYCFLICSTLESGLLAENSYKGICADRGVFAWSTRELKTGRLLLVPRSERKEAARTLLLPIEHLLAALPNLSPGEREWLESEEAQVGVEWWLLRPASPIRNERRSLE